MTMIADDWPAIRSHMFGDDTFLPKKKAESAPEVKPDNQELEIALKELLSGAFPSYTTHGGVDPAKPGSDTTVIMKPGPRPGIWEYYRSLKRNGEVREDDA